MASRPPPPAVRCASVLLAGTLAALLLAACAASAEKKPQPTAKPAEPAPTEKPPASVATAPSRAGTDRKLTQAVVAPLADLNLVREPIPTVLVLAQKAPYAVPEDTSCEALGLEIAALDAELDPDLDTLPAAGDPTLLDCGTKEATNAVIGAVRSTTEGVLPFRGWIRRLTGAERHAQEVAGAVSAGTVRRAFLKGLGQSAGCQPPAAPLAAPPPRASASAPAGH